MANRPQASLRKNGKMMLDVRVEYTLDAYQLAGLIANYCLTYGEQPETAIGCLHCARLIIKTNGRRDGLWDEIDDETRALAYSLVRQFFPDLGDPTL